VAIKLNIEIVAPMDASDHELLSGIAVMVLAIANHELAEQRFPEAFNDGAGPEVLRNGGDQTVETPEHPATCGFVAEDGKACISKAGHRGRHALRSIAVDATEQPLAN
jgi:hypothetical protein